MLVWDETDVLTVLAVSPKVEADGIWHKYVVEKDGIQLDILIYQYDGYEEYRLRDFFNKPSVECDEGMAWEIAATACKCLEAKEVYRIPQGNTHSYVLLTEVRHSR